MDSDSSGPGCPLCGKTIDPVPKAEGVCSSCGRQTEIVASCSDGHSLCASCIEPVIRSEVKRICLASDSKDPYEILEAILGSPIVFGRTVKFHIALPAALVTAYNNASVTKLDLPEALDEAMRRGDYVPPKACGHWGTCGAAVSCGIFFSVVTGTTPLSGRMYASVNKLTGNCLIEIGDVFGPRCCNRNTLKAVRYAVGFVKDELGVEMEWHDRVCDKQAWNKQCLGSRCPFHPEHTA